MLCFSPEKTIATTAVEYSLRATTGCSTLGLFGLLGREVDTCLYLLSGSQVVMNGYDFGQVGGMMVTRGCYINTRYTGSRDAGTYPPTCIFLGVKRGDP